MSGSEMQTPSRARGRTFRTIISPPQNNECRRPGLQQVQRNTTRESGNSLAEIFATNLNLTDQQNYMPSQNREDMEFPVPWGYETERSMGRGKKKLQPSSTPLCDGDICSAILNATSNLATPPSTANTEKSWLQTPATQNTDIRKEVPLDHQLPIVAEESKFHNIPRGFPAESPNFSTTVEPIVAEESKFHNIPRGFSAESPNFSTTVEPYNSSLLPKSGATTIVAPQLEDTAKVIPSRVQLPIVLEPVISMKPECPVIPQGTAADPEVSSSQAVPTAVSCIQSKNKIKGTAGRAIPLQANCFRLCSAEDWVVYRYNVHFQPPKPLISSRKTLLKGHEDSLGAFIYDGTVLFSGQVYPNNPMQLVSTRSKDGAKVIISVTRERPVTPGEKDYTYVLKMLLRKCLSGLKMKLIGNNYYDPSAKKTVNVNHRCDWELWPGFILSIYQSEKDMLLHADITHKVIRTDTVLDLMNAMWRQRSTNDNVIRSAVQGLEVLTPYNNRTYFICDINFTMTPATEFTMKDGEVITFKQYYLKKYEKRISDMSQPILVSKVKNPKGEINDVYLVPELCQLIGLNIDWRERDMFLLRTLAECTNFAPGKHIEKIKQFIQHMVTNTPTAKILKDWNMELKPKLVELEGRVLPAEKILFSESNKHAEITFNGNPEFFGAKMFMAKKLKRWVVLVPVDMLKNSKPFLKKLVEAGRELGLQMDKPEILELQNGDVSTYTKELSSLLSNSKPQLILCFTPDKREDRYQAIKNKCSINNAVPTQIITKKSLDNHWDLPIARRVIVQINCKIGGAPWSVHIPLSDLMVVGVDICEDSLKKGMYHCSLVASINRSCSRFFSVTTSFTSRQELTRQLCDMFVEALHKYKERNQGKLPLHVVFYRDGVKKKDISNIHEQEVAYLKDIMNVVYEGRQWSLAFVVVTNHPNTRFFSLGGLNPPPGTVVDNCITRPELYDFYILSGRAHKLTNVPTMYIVVSDNTILDPDKMQRLTYKLAHLYYNIKGIMHTPALVRYAKRLVQQVSYHMHKPPHPDLCELLHFL